MTLAAEAVSRWAIDVRATAIYGIRDHERNSV